MKPRICFVSLLFLLLIALCRGEIVELTDGNFEHQTQASTGMTTGSWFVFFKAEHCPHCERIYPEFDKLAQDEELQDRGIVLATMDVPSNRATATRFGIRGFPSFLFFHKGELYAIRGKRNAETWKSFLLEGVKEVSGVPIPPPLSPLGEFVKTLQAAGREFVDAAAGKSGPEGYLIVAMISITVLVMGGLISLFFLPARPSDQMRSTRKTKTK